MTDSIIQASFFDGTNASGEPVKVVVDQKTFQIQFNISRYDSFSFNIRGIGHVEYFNESLVIEIESKKYNLYGKLIVKNQEGIEILKIFLEKNNNSDFKLDAFIKNSENIPVLSILAVTLPLIAVFISIFLVIIFNIYRVVPESADASLGEIAYSQFLINSEVCKSEELNGVLYKIAHRIKPRDYRYRIDITIIKSDLVNAISLPGGKIIFFTGLLRSSETPEEIAGIMAHELVHVYRRHGLQQVLRVGSISLLISLITGGTFEGLETFETITEIGSTILFLKYSRNFEEEADEEASEILKNSNIGVEGLVAFFQRFGEKSIVQDMMEGGEASEDLDKKKENDSSFFSNDLKDWMSTHPMDEKRIQKLQQFVKVNKYPVKSILNEGAIWNDIKESCN